MPKVELNVGALVGATEKALIRGVKKSVVILEAELKRLTPEDTLEMLNSYVSDVSSNGDTVTGEVGNTADHAVVVEYGKDREYNYHKPKGKVVYRGVGNRTFARARDNMKQKILSTITEEIGKQ